MKHVVMVGACYLDTILREAHNRAGVDIVAGAPLLPAIVPFFPKEDTKLRATSLSVRRGGNCPNSLEVLVQLLDHRNEGAHSEEEDVKLHLVCTLPERSSGAAQKILDSFGDSQHRIDFDRCLFRSGCTEAASSYIIRSEAAGTRTLVNYNDLPEMTAEELIDIVNSFPPDDEYIFHFEGRVTDVALACVHAIRKRLPKVKISVECEKPGRPGLPELAAEADIVLYSQVWAQSRGYSFAEHCLKHETRPKAELAFCTWGARGSFGMSSPDQELCRFPEDGPLPPVQVADAIGAGDTFIAGVLYGLLRHPTDWKLAQRLEFSSSLATLKVQREGFAGLGADMLRREA